MAAMQGDQQSNEYVDSNQDEDPNPFQKSLVQDIEKMLVS
jgi:hypothetical protein